MSPTQRSLKHLRSEGFEAHIVEKWNQWARIRQDAFGIGDILCYVADSNSLYAGNWLIQATSGANHTARVKKVMASEHIKGWLVHGRFAVISWAKKKNRWVPRWEEIVMDPFEGFPPAAKDAPEVK